MATEINEEDVIADGKHPYAYSAESGAAHVVCTAAKAYTERGCDKSGVAAAADWNTHLEGIEIENKLVTCRAN